MTFVTSRARGWALLLLLLGFLVVPVVPAFAHVELTASDPVDGTTLTQSPDAIELRYTAGVATAGDGLVLVDAAGEPQAIDIQQPAEDRFLIVPLSPLPSGSYALSWTVRSGDAHPRSGAITFAVAGGAATPLPGSESELPRSTGDSAGSATSDPVEAAVPTVLTTLVESEAPPGEGVARMGRWLSLLGALIGIGVIVFAATTLVGTPREVAEATYWLRRCGGAIVFGTGIEVLGTSMMLSGSVLDAMLPSGLLTTLIGPLGIAVVLRVGGGLALLRGATIAVRAPQAGESGVGIGATVPAGTAPAALLTESRVATRHRMDLSGSAVAIAGAAAVALSYLFDGHTVTTAPAVVVRVAAVTHVVAAGVWVGGVLMLGRLLAWRRSRGELLRAAELAVRFSRVAALALAAVAIAGLALTWAILDAPGELISTPWGRFLLLKLALVGVAVGLGGYNHHFVVPYLDGDDDEEAVANRLRRVVRIEGAMLVGVVAVTAALVGAAS